MSPKKSEVTVIEAIEAVVCRDVGRGTRGLIEATRGELAAAAAALASSRSVGLITGFYVPRRGRSISRSTASPILGRMSSAHTASHFWRGVPDLDSPMR